MATLERDVASRWRYRLDDPEDPGTASMWTGPYLGGPVRNLDRVLCDLQLTQLVDASAKSLVDQYLYLLFSHMLGTSTDRAFALRIAFAHSEANDLALEDEADDESMFAATSTDAEATTPASGPTMEEYLQRVQMWADKYRHEIPHLSSEELRATYDSIAPSRPTH